jgi:hypothetical protein
VAKLLGDQFAGIWYDNDDGGKLKVGVTERARGREQDIRHLLDARGLAADTDLVPVRYTEAALQEKVRAVHRQIADMVENGRALTSYNTKINSVVLTTHVKLPAAEEERVKRLSLLEGVTVRRVSARSLLSKLVSCNVTYCNPPLRGGREVDATNLICTAAFMVRDNSNPSHLLAMTAGHCNFFGLNPWTANDESNVPHTVGNGNRWYFAGDTGRDAGLININSPGYWSSPYPPAAEVVVKPSSNDAATTTYDPTYTIKATGWSSIGQVLCRTGRTTGTECGVVDDLGAEDTATGPDGIDYTTTNMGHIDVCGAQPGDSGGPLYKQHIAYGILSSVLDSWYDCHEAYQGVRGAEAALNVQLLLTP